MTYVIAEAGINHCGSLDRALKMIEVAADAGANAVKFQSFTATELGYDAKLTAFLKGVELSEEDHLKLMVRADACNIDFISTPFDRKWCDWLVDNGVQQIKISSGKVKDVGFCQHVQGKGLPVIISNGMCTSTELAAVATPFTIILYCVSEYPTQPWRIDFRKMLWLGATYHQYGFSDHTAGIEASIYAAAMGAKVIEAHFTLDRLLPGPDQVCSKEPNELKAMIGGIRNV